jgi:glucokinase
MTQGETAGLILAVDLGGTKVAAGLVSAQGRLILRKEEPTCQDGPERGVDQIVRLLWAVLSESDHSPSEIQGIGVGIPAVLEQVTDRVIWAPNLAGWRDVALRASLEQRLCLPAYIEYDGHAAVLGEWWLGAGRGFRSVAMVIVGTGIGGGMILDGRLYRGRDRLAGAAGWFAMTANASLQDLRGHSTGHWESLAAGPAIARQAMSGLKEHPTSSLAARIHTVTAGADDLPTEESITAKQVFEAARAGDDLAGKIVASAGELIGLGVANIVSLVNPEIVILGGSVGRQGDLLIPHVKAVVKRWAQPASANSIPIEISQLGSDAGLLGAAYAVLERAVERR